VFENPRLPVGNLGVQHDQRAQLDWAERDWYSMNDLHSPSASRRRECTNLAAQYVDMTHTQRGGLLMGMHPSRRGSQAPPWGVVPQDMLTGRAVASPAMPNRASSRDEMSPQTHREMALMQELRVKQEELRMHQEDSRRERDALMKEVRLQQEDNKQLRETITRLSVELRLCTMVVQEVSSLMGRNHSHPPIAKQAPVESVKTAVFDSTASGTGAVDMEAVHTREKASEDPTSSSLPTSPRVSNNCLSSETTVEDESPHDALHSSNLASSLRQPVGALPLSPYSKPWSCMTWTLQTLGRQLMHSMLDVDIEYYCERNRQRVAKLAKFRAYALSKVQAAAASLWPRAVCKIFGSVATGLSVPSSDVDIIVCLPKVLSRESEPSLARADVMQGRHVIKGGNLQANLAQFLHNADWVQSETLKTIETSLVPVIQFSTRRLSQYSMPAHVPGNRTEGTNFSRLDQDSEPDRRAPGYSLEPHRRTVASFQRSPPYLQSAYTCAMENGEECIKIDVTFEGPNHRGLAAVQLVRSLMLVAFFCHEVCQEAPYFSHT